MEIWPFAGKTNGIELERRENKLFKVLSIDKALICMGLRCLYCGTPDQDRPQDLNGPRPLHLAIDTRRQQ